MLAWEQVVVTSRRLLLARVRADASYQNRAVRIRKLCKELDMPVLVSDPPLPPRDPIPPHPGDEEPLFPWWRG